MVMKPKTASGIIYWLTPSSFSDIRKKPTKFDLNPLTIEAKMMMESWERAKKATEVGNHGRALSQ